MLGAQWVRVGLDISVLQSDRIIVQHVEISVDIRRLAVVLAAILHSEIVDVIIAQQPPHARDLAGVQQVLGPVGAKNLPKVVHGVDDHAIFREGKDLVLNGLEIAFNRRLFILANSYQLGKDFVLERDGGRVIGFVQ